MCEGDISVLICDGSTKQCNIALECWVEKVFFSVKFYQFYHFLRVCTVVHASAFYTRIYESAKTGLGNQTRTACCTLSPKVDDDALRQAVGRNLVLACLIAKRESTSDMSTGPLRDQSRSCLTETGNTAVSMFGICLRERVSVPAVKFVSVSPVPQCACLL